MLRSTPREKHALDKTWKSAERAIANLTGGRRRGADYGGVRGGKTDIILDGYAIEVKQSKRPMWSLLVSAVEQAERNGQPNEKPIAIIHKTGTPYLDSIVCYRLATFIGWEVGEPPEGD